MAKYLRVDTNAMEWENGLDVVRAMAPEFQANLGPPDLVEELFPKYHQKTLRVDPDTARRIDLIDIQPGYRDLTNAYHDSVEECLVLGGELDLDGEGHFVAGDYFWRPPGFVHAARTEDGFQAILSLQGEDASEDSRPTSRRIRPNEEAGTNPLHGEDIDAAVGPRGWVKRLPTSLVAWQPGPVFTRSEMACHGFDLEHTEFKLLSKNPYTGAQSVLMRLLPGFGQTSDGFSTTAWEAYVVSGSFAIGDNAHPEGVYVHVPGRTVLPPMSSEGGAVLFMKTDSWLERGLA